jgi:hypothetical protein
VMAGFELTFLLHGRNPRPLGFGHCLEEARVRDEGIVSKGGPEGSSATVVLG